MLPWLMSTASFQPNQLDQRQGNADRRIEIPGYRLHATIGEGGEGQVWLATRIECGSHVALKISHRRLDEDDEMEWRNRRGFSALSALKCRGIAGAIDRGELSSGESWQATAYIAGRNLVDEVNRIDRVHRDSNGASRQSPFPVRPVLELFERVCAVVDLVHQLGVIHRDLKPANIIVDDEGQPWLVDFGLAKKPAAIDATMVTLPGHFIGTIQCASPEQVDGRPERVDHRTDLYSLGVILYQITTGTFPYDVNGSLSKIFDRIRFAAPIEPRTIATWMDRDLQGIILKALEKEPSRRYQSAAQFRDDIRRYLDGAPVMARQSNFKSAVIKFAARHRKAAALSITLAVFAILYAVTVTFLLQRANRAEADAAAQADSARKKFRMAQEMVEHFVMEVVHNLRDWPGSAEMRTKLLTDGYAKFSVLLAEREQDPLLQGDLAQTLIRMSDIALSLGRLEECEKHRLEALEIRRRLADSNPNDVAAQEGLSIALVLVGDFEKARGQTAKAAALYKDALAIDEALVQSHPGNRGLANNLAWSYERVGAIVDTSKEPEKQLDFFLKRHALCERLVADEPDNPEHLFNLLASHLLLTNSAVVGEAVANDHVSAAAPLADRLLEIGPDNERFVHYFVLTQWTYAKFAQREQNRDAARRCIDRAIEESTRLHDAQPDHILYNKLLSSSLCGMAELHAEGGDSVEALKWQCQAIPYAQAYCLAMPDNPEARFGLAEAISNLLGLIRAVPSDDSNRTEAENLIRSSLQILPPDCEPPGHSPNRERFLACRETYGKAAAPAE